MGFDNDCILNIQSLAGEYFCPVCHLLVYPNEALQAPCTHLYCKPCLTYVVSTNHACPYDGYRVTEADCKPLMESNKALADTIAKIQVHCLYYRTGCTWQGALSDCTSHCSTCAFGESPVLCNRCGIQLVHRQVQEHAQNCPGVQSQGQQPGAAQDATSTGAGSASDQNQTAIQTGAAASQGQTTQASAVPVSSQDANQPANSAAQPQVAQPQAAQPQAAPAAAPTMEQWYQQQQQYQQQCQQYYQQYPGYDPYQQHYQYYYQAQQYQQQPTQAYGQAQPQAYAQAQPQAYNQAQPQAYNQAQPQAYGQAQIQPQLQAQPSVQSHAQAPSQQQAQAPSLPVQSQSQPQPQPAVNAQPQVQQVGQSQSQMHAHSQGPPSHIASYNQAQQLPQAQATQPYAQQHPVPQQQMQLPQYQQAHPQMHHPHPQPYPQSQTQHYPYPQTQTQLQPPPQPNPQPPHPPSQPNQPITPGSQVQAQNAVTGYQSYPQMQQHPQAQAGAAPPMQVSGTHQQAQFVGQMQGQFPSQASQVRPPQPYATVPNQQHPAPQGQVPAGPPAQQPVYPHAQQAGYAYPQRPGVQAAQAVPQQYIQQQSFPGQNPSMQPHLNAQGSSHLQSQPQQNYAAPPGALPNATQNYAGRPMFPQGAASQPYVQAAGLAGSGQARPPQLNQTYPMRVDNKLSIASEQPINPKKIVNTVDGQKPLDQMVEKGAKGLDDLSKEERDIAGVVGMSAGGNESKKDVLLDSASEHPGSEKVHGTDSKLVENDVHESKRKLKDSTAEGVLAPSADGNVGKGGAKDIKKTDAQDLKHTVKSNVGASASASLLPQSHIPPQGHGLNSFPSNDQGRSQVQPMHYGPTAQPRPGIPVMPHPMSHPGNPQLPALLGHPSNQLRPHGPGQVPPGPPFHAVDNPQSSIHKHPPAASVPLDRPLGEPFLRPFAVQQPGAYDSHGSVTGREPLPRSDVIEPRPPYPLENEKFPPQKRLGYCDGRFPDSHPHGPVERAPHGIVPPVVQPGASKFNIPSGHDSMPPPGMRDERSKHFPEDQFKPFPRRDLEDDLRKYPRPSNVEAGSSSKVGSQFPVSEPLDHAPHMIGVDGPLRPFDKRLRGFERDSGLKMDPGVGSGPSRFLPPFHPNDIGGRDRAAGFPDDNIERTDFGRHLPGPGFGRHRMDGLPPRSPGKDFTGFPPRTFGAYRDVDGNESSFEGSKPYGFPAEPFGKSIHDSRHPVPPHHLHINEVDVPGNFRASDHLVGGPHNLDVPPNHFRRVEGMGSRNLHLRDGAAFGLSGRFSQMGEPPFGENFPPHVPFGESLGGEKPRHSLVGQPGFRSSFAYQRHGRDGGFHAGEFEPFDNLRKQKSGSIMCRICKVECGTVEGLDLHSQSREHQRKAMDMVISIKQHNKKKQKISNDPGSVEGGRDGSKPKSSKFEGRGNKR